MPPPPCQKHPYTSVRAARLACRKTGARLRVYYCRDCRTYHVTGAEKRNGRMKWRDR